MRRIAGAIGLIYALLVFAMNLAELTRGLTTLIYATCAVLAPIAVVAGDRLAHRGNGRADGLAQLGLGVLFGIWALPASSGAIALVALGAGLWSAFRSPHRLIAVLALLAGVGIGVGVLAVSFTRS